MARALAVCAEACCAGGAPRTMSDYIESGFRRRAAAALPIAGPRRDDAAGRFAQFTLRCDAGLIADVAFDASVCATLIAYCEVAAERSMGRSLPEAASLVTPLELAGALPAVPPARRDRALLAAQALIGSIVEAARERES